jgi:hypothetical protein
MTTIPQLGFILSLPRSGSTVLTAMLDQVKGICCAPESSFPQILGELSAKERANPRWMAALYLGATFTPTPLGLEEAGSCMQGSNEDILIRLGKAVAGKLGRDPDLVEAVVWKTPRTVGMHAGPISTGGKFIILRRNPHNVFESQFRVSFGEKNRNPYRFAIFQESYEHAFAKVPANRRIDIAYDDLPDVIPTLCGLLGVQSGKRWESGTSNLEMAAKDCAWMSEVTQEFNNKDPEKRSRLDQDQVARLERAMNLARPLRGFLGPLRSYFDHQSAATIRQRASALLAETS